jgi:DNA-binding response OmpR family regulator
MTSQEKPTAKAAKDGGGKRILIIEDERPLSHALELKFTHEGFACTVANNGAEGLKEANTGKYAMILLDLIMPEMDGFTFLQNLKKKTPVIVLSNLGQDEDRARAKELGAKEYMVKSNTPITEIVKMVKTFL